MTALQAEHIHMLNKLPQVKQAMAARTEKDLDRIHALIIPGGESTDCRTGVGCSNPFTIPLFFSWGTCADMLLLAKEAHGAKKRRDSVCWTSLSAAIHFSNGKFQ